MKINDAGLELIKSFEGCRLVAYDDLQPYKTITDKSQVKGTLTIGYGHIEGVYVGMTITQQQAEELLRNDMRKYEQYVEKYVSIPLNENQFSALVSFAYNCGVGNLKKLVKNRTALQIADAIRSYNKASGKVLAGLQRRRNAERELFLSGANPYKEPNGNIKKGTSGNGAKWLQFELNKHGYNLTVDGIAGTKTITALKDFQNKNGLIADGIAGVKTKSKLKE